MIVRVIIKREEFSMPISKGTKIWLRGLIRAIIGGVTNVVGQVVTDPHKEYNFERIGASAAIGAIIAVVFFLEKSPLPEDPEEVK